MIVDLRSDTVTRPTPGMLEAMMNARVGDDVFKEDPEINELQREVAAYFGKEAGLFCPSGTMSNQIAIRCHTRPGDEVICADVAHVYLYEGGGIASNSGSSVRLLKGDRGRLTAGEVRGAILPDDDHLPRTRLVCLEDTVNKGGGCYYELSQIAAIAQVCHEHGLSLHLDGARLFNALVETGYDPVEYASHFDSISICFSKGMGAPVGSVLIGSAAFMHEARRVRKSLGGGMRQAGYLANACRYALKNHTTLLKDDHRRARAIGDLMHDHPQVKAVVPVETNIVIVELQNTTAAEFQERARQLDVLCLPFGPDKIRFVTHLDFGDGHLEAMREAFAKW
ncbi:MAG: aminotransferase class I/II-fold pyridoxal phosphate-dependent enzyme [Flavobacteriales bacterium]|nr:aminotransferase class I/II-fold pyridoxal phosphate-dependent enzyme [Flavobacteriales bacterium]